MSAPPVYLLDANVFITASRRYYAFDLVPTFWSALVANAHTWAYSKYRQGKG